ncbi:hypothetical protein [Bradyrhizobium sp. S3.2.12]|uniref:hypothetical protein n=1 Tax=Bradyrhizobium sp. S3.2.12 TaxID=3156387 RepID=UPI0033985D21
MLRYDHRTGAGCIFHLDLFHPAFFDNEAAAAPCCGLRPRRLARSIWLPYFLPMSSAAVAIGEGIVPKQNCLIVRVAGRQLDLLRGEASRIAKGHNVDWWIDRAEVGTRFCFEDIKAKQSFALACDNFGIPCQDA